MLAFSEDNARVKGVCAKLQPGRSKHDNLKRMLTITIIAGAKAVPPQSR
jgi:hypothetical protein